jgi:hypothetical protein
VSLDALELLALNATFSAIGIPARVTPVGASQAIVTSAIWLGTVAQEFPSGGELQRREMKRVVAFQRSAVPTLPRGSVIVGAEREGGVDETWRVDALELLDPVQLRVVVIPAGA